MAKTRFTTDYENHLFSPREEICMKQTTCVRFRHLRGSALGRIIAVANQKGGVGKTTTAVNLAASLAISEQPTLLIDCDPQGNTTSAIGFPKDPARRTLLHALILEDSLDRIILKTQVDGLDLLPADKNLVGAAIELVSNEKREYQLKSLLEQVKNRYSYVI